MAFSGAVFIDNNDAVAVANMAQGTQAHERLQNLIKTMPQWIAEEEEIVNEYPPIRGFIDLIMEYDNETVLQDDTNTNANANASRAVLSITNFENVKSNSQRDLDKTNNIIESESEILNTLPSKNNSNNLLAGGNRNDTNDTNDNKEQDEQKSTLLEDTSKEDHSEDQDGGVITDGIVYEIDFLIADDKE
jgi:hypothetical protein